jgi:hypothetical protein
MNLDCIRDILLEVEEKLFISVERKVKWGGEGYYPYDDFEIIVSSHLSSHNDLKYLSKYSSDKIEENSVILSKYGLLKEHINIVNRYELTPEGHLFLADIKNDENWLKIKEISDKIGFSSLDSIKEIISYLRKSLINDCFITHI